MKELNKFALAHYRDAKRHHWNKICPSCGKREFSPYIDLFTGQPIDDKHCGKCNRETNCGYHQPPREWFSEHRPERREWLPREQYIALKRQERREAEEAKQRYMQREAERKARRFDPFSSEQHPDAQAYIDRMGEWCERSQSTDNTLAKWLYTLPDVSRQQVDNTLRRYRTGSTRSTDSTRDGWMVYWQIDLHGQVRTGKLMRYGDDGHRYKGDGPRFNWAHAVAKMEQLADQCLFGEHLLMEHKGSIALVESEKTALIMAIKCPNILWLATGGKQNFRHEVLWPLCGYDVFVLPDADALDEWSRKIEVLNREHGYHLTIPDHYRAMCTPEARERKWDLVDFLLSEE